jgi:hypothetical protein
MAEKKENLKVADKGSSREPPPSASRQKTFVVENAAILDQDTKKAILRLVMMEVGKTNTVATAEGTEVRPVILENRTTGAVSIHLDNIDNPDVILHIYNIVSNRRASLNEPANSSKR